MVRNNQRKPRQSASDSDIDEVSETGGVGCFEAVVEATPSREGARAPKPYDFLDTVLERVLGKLDVEGLGTALAERVASRVATNVREEDLVEALAPRVQAAITDRLCAKLADRLLGG